MRISALKRRHWIAIALVVGLIHGSIRQSSESNSQGRLDDFDVLLTDARQFEQALLSEVQGRRLFQDLTIYPYQLGPGRAVHLVTGRYWDGRPEMKDGQLQARWAPACFIAPIPYRAPPPEGRSMEGKEFPSVLDYLATLNATAGVRFRYAWWWWMIHPLSVSVAASLLFIGALWPTLINLLTYGTLTRPREAKGASLWRMKNAGDSRLPSRGAGVALGLEESSDMPALNPVAAPPQSAHPAAVPVLTGAPLEAAPLTPSEEKEFGARREDFYPTELHVPESRSPT
jgi:hypothetical protein